MMHSLMAIAAIALLQASIGVDAFATVPLLQRSSTVLTAHKSRGYFLRESFTIGGLLLLGGAQAVYADDGDIAATPATSLAACKIQSGKPSNCVSTSSVKQVDCYIAPWTFDGVSANEAKARLKGVFAADPDIYKDLHEDNGYLRVNAGRGLVTDQLEFLFDEKESLVKVRSAEVYEDTPSSISDFGANRRRLDGIRKDAKVFEVMGGGYDSIEMRGTGPVGQLKAFYGLQSGAGFEDLYADE